MSVTVTDDDGMTFSRQSVTVAEAGGSATYTVRLQTQPAGNVTVTVASSSAAAVTPESLTFTPSNWNAPQTVTVTGVDDDLDNGLSRSAEIAHTGYGSPEIVTVTVTDDEDAPTLEIRGGEAIEGNTGTTPLRFTVAKHGATDQRSHGGLRGCRHGHGDGRHRLHRHRRGHLPDLRAQTKRRKPSP